MQRTYETRPGDRAPRGPVWADEILDLVDGQWHAWTDLPLSGPENLQNFATRRNVKKTLTYFSTGSTGQPKRVDYSESDWAEAVTHRAECLTALGVRSGDVAAVVIPYGPWFSGDNVSDALLSLGVRVLPAGMYGPHLSAAAHLMDRIGAQVVVTTPSLAMALAAEDTKLRPRLIVLLGERCPPALVPHLKQRFGAELKSIYAASEAIVGPQEFTEPGTYRWDPRRLHLEILRGDGIVVEEGAGELLITRRYGCATPLIRYRIGDQVELSPPPRPRVRLLGRIGHAFSLATGVKVGHQLLAGFLDTLPAVVSEADFLVNHGADGRDLLTVTLSIVSGALEPDGIQARLAAASLDLADAVGSGHVEIRAQVRAGCLRGKRRLRVTERPWKL